mmetsp:Transcript_5033/g.17681  ORF Transcript_5033/g.17681 Transcript_5033/m.17681 type:complete len:221 (+) Transcript_5033:1019-1681(+)
MASKVLSLPVMWISSVSRWFTSIFPTSAPPYTILRKPSLMRGLKQSSRRGPRKSFTGFIFRMTVELHKKRQCTMSPTTAGIWFPAPRTSQTDPSWLVLGGPCLRVFPGCSQTSPLQPRNTRFISRPLGKVSTTVRPWSPSDTLVAPTGGLKSWRRHSRVSLTIQQHDDHAASSSPRPDSYEPFTSQVLLAHSSVESTILFRHLSSSSALSLLLVLAHVSF